MENNIIFILKHSIKETPLNKEELVFLSSIYNRDTIFNDDEIKNNLPFVAKFFCINNIDYDYWNEIYHGAVKRNTWVLGEVHKIFTEFKLRNLTNAFVYENFGILLASEADIACFNSNDVDIFADVRKKQGFIEAMESIGYTQNNATEENIRDIRTEFINSSDNSFIVNIMWEPMARYFFPIKVDLNFCGCWVDTKRYMDTNIVLPNNDVLAYFSLLHVSTHYYCKSPGIRLYWDVDNVVKISPNWGNLIKFAKHDNTLIMIEAVVYIYQELIGDKKISLFIDIKEKVEPSEDVLKIFSIVTHKIEDDTFLRYNISPLETIRIEALSRGVIFWIVIFRLFSPFNASAYSTSIDDVVGRQRFLTTMQKLCQYYKYLLKRFR